MFFILGGRRMHEVLHSNFQSIFPSPRTVESKLDKYDMSVEEGKINVKMLKHFLIQHNLPMVVSIAEEATAIVGRREYAGIKSNSVIGFSLPLENNGLPDSSLSKVKTAENIINMFASFERATNVMVIMAQPLAQNVSPIRICSFGTNNKFTAEDVKNR